ncbi:MAG: hypothetical protein ACXACK_19465, partial [Candidatus Hodarchaeales archaeon]
KIAIGKGFTSKLSEPFLKLNRVPSRFIQDFPVPDLPVVHQLGTRTDNSSLPVGFSSLDTDILLTSGSSNLEIISILQQLIWSFSCSQLQHICREIELEPYPSSGLVDIFYELHKRRRSLIDEFKTNQGERSS